MGRERDDITVYNVYLEVEKTERIRPGMTANISIFVEEAEDALLAPIEAVYSEDEQGMVEVLKDGRAEPREVNLGLIGSRYVEILEGLEEGEKVITGSSEDMLHQEELDEDDVPGIMPGGE